MSSLRGKQALITGTSQGIGAATAEHLIEAGCHLVMHYHSSSELPGRLVDKARAAGQRAIALQADLTNHDQAARFAREAIQFLGGLDVLINNTGSLLERRSIGELDVEFWQRTVDINLTSMLVVTRECVPALAEARGASIVNVASLAGRAGGHAGSLAYSTAKGAVLTWTRSLATEVGPRGIRVNAVAPGLILGTRFHATHTTEESARKTVEGIPLGRAGTPEDVARGVAFLAAEYDGFIHGATLDINGGVYRA